MIEDDKGKRFLQLIEEQNKIQWDIMQKLASLIQSNWKSAELQQDLKSLMDEHKKITNEINGLDNSLL